MMGCENFIPAGAVVFWMLTLAVAALGGFVAAMIGVRCGVGLVESLRNRPIEILGS